MSRSVVFGLGLSLMVSGMALGQDGMGKLSFTVVDEAMGTMVPCCMYIKNSAGEPYQPKGLPFWRDHFSCKGTVDLELPAGAYTYLIERGPEYTRQSGTFRIAAGSSLKLNRTLERRVDMAAAGWWSGDLHVHRPLEDIELTMLADDLHIAPVITWWNARNTWAGREIPKDLLVNFDGDRYYRIMGGEDERNGGAFMFFNLDKPLDISWAEKEYPSPLRFIEEARKLPNAWIDIEKPFWWDVPVALAYGFGDSIGLANNHMCHSSMLDNEAWGKPRDLTLYPSPRGNGQWSQDLYYHILNAGIRIPPSAGSASGVLPNPVGYNRVYVYLGDKLDYAAWWEGLRAGRSFVTNGPLLRTNVNGELPGHVFKAGAGETVTLDVKCTLDTLDPVPVIEIVKNGKVERAVPYAEWEKTGGLGTLTFDRSGWFLIRAIADVQSTFRFASTAPYYVEIGADSRLISKASVAFFLEWVNARVGRIKIEDPEKRREVLAYHETAKAFWEKRLREANAE